jgi:hypothetical protein
VLDGDHGHALRLRHIDGPEDVRERLLARGVLDLQDSVEVLLLDVDDDQRSARCGHRLFSSYAVAPVGCRLAPILLRGDA